MHRRAFLQTLTAAWAAPAPPQPAAAPVKLGFDTYSIRAFNWKMPQFLEYEKTTEGRRMPIFQLSKV